MTADTTTPSATRRYEAGDVVAERYELLERLGDGAMGVVFRARDLYVDGAHEIVAVKLVHPALARDPQVVGRFRREARILAELDHPNVCRMYELVSADDALLLALEHIDGVSLERYLEERGPLPLDECVALTEQICAALAAAHERDVVHRDLKPANVLVEGAGVQGSSFHRGLRAKVVDFGLGKVLSGHVAGTVLTDENMVFGTPEYMSPEQAAGEVTDHRVDVYSLGVVVFELLTGRVPFSGPTPIATMGQHLNEPPPPLCDAASGRVIPRSVERVVNKALSKRPAQRFDTAQAFARALAAAATEASVSGAPPSGTSDTLIEPPRPESTTLQSPRDQALEGPELSRGAKVKIVVADTSPRASARPSPKASRHAGTPRPRISAAATIFERHGWSLLFVTVVGIAVGLGVWLGLR